MYGNTERQDHRGLISRKREDPAPMAVDDVAEPSRATSRSRPVSSKSLLPKSKRPSQTDASNPILKKPSPPLLARYPNLPDGHAQDPYYWVLGWPTANPPFKRFVREYRKAHNGGGSWCGQLESMRHFLHFRRLLSMSVLADGVEFTEFPDMTAKDCEAIPRQQVVMLAHTGPGRTLIIRPEDYHYQRMKKVFGEPVWMKDYVPKRWWHHMHAMTFLPPSFY